MEPQSPSVAKCTEYSNSALNWFLHHKQLHEKESEGDFSVGRDEFWEGQWSGNVKEWANFDKQAQMMDQNLVLNCDSPLASDSSSSLSTWESSFVSWNSENSYAAGKHVLQSPEVLSGRFSGFSLFNSGINHLETVSKEEDLHGKLEQRTFDPSFECSRHLGFQFLSKGRNDDGWVSDSDDSQSWVSTSSQELTLKDPLEKANVTHLGRPSHNHNTLEVCERRSHAYSYKETTACVSGTCGFDARQLASKDVNADALTHPNYTSSEKLCCAAPHKPCTFIFAPETYQMHLVQDSEIEILNEQRVCNEHCKGHGVHGRHGLPEHEENEHEISQDDSARDDRKAKAELDLCKQWLPPLAKTVLPKSLQSGYKTRPLSHTKPMYSADVKEKYASSTLHGYLRFAEQNGSPCYSFFVDDSDEVLFARVCGQERLSNKENCDWTYTFHSKKDIGKAKAAWTGRPKNQRLASDLVANMKVPDVCKDKKNQYGHAKEAHFVLYNAGGQQNMESSTIGNKKLQSQPLKPVSNNMAASQVVYTQPSVGCWHIDSSVNKGSCSNDCASNNISKKRPCHSGNVKSASGCNKYCAQRLNSRINQRAELAAIVISTSMKETKMTRRKESKPPRRDGAGWGVKYLDKGSESGWGLSFMEKSSRNATNLVELRPCAAPNKGGQVEFIGDQTACQNNVAQLPINKGSHAQTCLDPTQEPEKSLSGRKNRLKVNVTVILPAGDHGLPTEDEEDDGGGGHLHGPTPLLQRWVSGGECECGGWDMGCGLSVFKGEPLRLHTATSNIGLTRHDRMNWLSPGNPLKVFTQGYKQKKVLVLEVIEAGLFSLSFQARFSPLQAFATAVALFHQQMTHK